jgi:hypothetical protein
MKKTYTLRGQKGEIIRQPKNRIWASKPLWSCDIFIERKFYIEQEKVYFWGSIRLKISPQSPKTQIEFQNQYGRVMYLSKIVKNILLDVKLYIFFTRFEAQIPFLGSDSLFSLF